MTDNNDTVTVPSLEDLKISEGEVAVVKGSGKVKIRKGQSEEAYQSELKEFQSNGPTVNDIDWFKKQELSDVDINDKVSVTKYIHLLELLYYEREYKECLRKCQEFLKKFTTDEIVQERESQKKKKSKVIFTLDEVDDIKSHCLRKLQKFSKADVDAKADVNADV